MDEHFFRHILFLAKGKDKQEHKKITSRKEVQKELFEPFFAYRFFWSSFPVPAFFLSMRNEKHLQFKFEWENVRTHPVRN